MQGHSPAGNPGNGSSCSGTGGGNDDNKFWQWVIDFFKTPIYKYKKQSNTSINIS